MRARPRLLPALAAVTAMLLVVPGGPVVAQSIEQAREEWRRGRFETVPGDEEDFIPLPEDQTKARRAEGGVHYP